MHFQPDAWQRLEFEGTPLYIRDGRPDWFVPTTAGDRLLRRLQSGAPPPADPASAWFLQRLPPGCGGPVHPRGDVLHTAQLRELWFHLTNQCNLACRHCLFASAPSEPSGLPAERTIELIGQAHDRGCRVMALTGGEPFLYPGFEQTVDAILDHEECHAVVLTNGSLVRANRRALSRWGPERFHMQVSLDGLPARHDALRGKGAYEALAHQLAALRADGFPFTLSMCVEAENVADMPAIVRTAAELGASNVHFMWLFVRGRATAERFVSPERIFPLLREAHRVARDVGIGIDNIDAFRTQVFAPTGTVHDGTTAGWESAAVGPDGHLYPSAAMVGVPALATPIAGSLADTWQTSPALERVRNTTAGTLDTPLRFLLGGGDSDHSYAHRGTFVGDDPYWPLYESIALWLMTDAAARPRDDSIPQLRLKMGDLLESCGAHGAVALVHSNCLLATAQTDSRTAVKNYYSAAAVETKEDILNPACYPPAMMEHIPAALRFRGYGCGSPVLDAAPEAGDCVVDLGCGRGVECFIAAKQVGPEGRVFGIDMLDPMLHIARDGAAQVAEALGYANMEFRSGYLEALPLEDNTAQLVLSNCVLNLSAHKRRTFSEILRVLQPGGRLVVSDVVCETEPGPALRNDDALRGECIAGALTQRDLVGLLQETGFTGFRVLKRVPYRDVGRHRFFSMTYEAVKPAASPTVRVLYRGPAAAIWTGTGHPVYAGVPAELPEAEARRLGDAVAILSDDGSAQNMDWVSACTCAVAPDEPTAPDVAPPPDATPPDATPRRGAGCMVCGQPLDYSSQEPLRRCTYCNERKPATAVCQAGHFVCDACHVADAVTVIERICEATHETDMLALLKTIRSHEAIPVHGPEHHAMVPGIILATYRNLGGSVSPAMLQTALHRGSRVMGGSCAFTGIGGAAAGVGIAFGLLLDATPLKPAERQKVLQATAEASLAIAERTAARCCQREVWIALTKAAELSVSMLPTPLRADEPVVCTQRRDNPHCIGAACPLAGNE